MRHRQEIEQFVQFCRVADDMGALQRLLDDVARLLGFQYVAMTHHVDLAAPPDDAISLVTYPDRWLDQIVTHRYFDDDPIHLASTRTAAGFRWSEVPRMIELTPRHRIILESARREGVGEGYTVPVHVPGEYRGTVSFAAASIEDLHPDAFVCAQYVSPFAFEAGRRIVGPATANGAPRLTDRQIDCIILAGRGKTDREIAVILGLSHATVREHLENARERYGVVSRTQLVVRALFDGHVSFSALIGGAGTLRL